ncbi:hypothetical protein PENTCL1PPCAC_29332, partial [Pristionchus entomophagus]
EEKRKQKKNEEERSERRGRAEFEVSVEGIAGELRGTTEEGRQFISTRPTMGASSILLACLLIFISATSTVSAAHCFFLKELAIIGGTYDEFETNDIRQCCIRCAQQTCCIAYTYDKIKRRCYMKSAIANSEERSYTTSGIKANIANGNGCKLNNIEIKGGSTHLNLKNSMECQAFCTAYGIYTWLPGGVNDDNESFDPVCTCTNRIVSLKYTYGAISSILPNTVTRTDDGSM